MKTRYYRDKKGEIRWHITGRNGLIIGASTEGYPTFGKAKANYAQVTLKAWNNKVEVDDNVAVKKVAAKRTVAKKTSKRAAKRTATGKRRKLVFNDGF